MLCTSCASGHQAEFTAEVNLHFDGPKYIDEPGVLMFPKLLVCLDCGFARFVAEKDGIGAPCKQYIGNGDFDTERNATEAAVCRGRVCLSRLPPANRSAQHQRWKRDKITPIGEPTHHARYLFASSVKGYENDQPPPHFDC